MHVNAVDGGPVLAPQTQRGNGGRLCGLVGLCTGAGILAGFGAVCHPKGNFGTNHGC